MGSRFLAAYRSLLREVAHASIRPTRQDKALTTNIRRIFESHRTKSDQASFLRDVDNAAVFMRSQRMYKALLERYNPLHDLTSEERIKATARRVGLDMPTGHKIES